MATRASSFALELPTLGSCGRAHPRGRRDVRAQTAVNFEPGGGRAECGAPRSGGEPDRRARIARSSSRRRDGTHRPDDWRRGGQTESRRRWGRGRRCGDRFGDRELARRPLRRRRRTARKGVRRLRRRRDDASRRVRSRYTRGWHHRWQRPRLGRRANRHRAGSPPRRAESARRKGPRAHQRRDCSDRLRGRPARSAEHPRHQSLDCGRCVRIVPDRSAHAGRRARSARRHHRGCRCREQRPQSARQSAVRRDQRPPAMPPGC